MILHNFIYVCVYIYYIIYINKLVYIQVAHTFGSLCSVLKHEENEHVINLLLHTIFEPLKEISHSKLNYSSLVRLQSAS